jgi:tRNA nucleotidyltransferase/poly(A) polymerase
MDIRFTSRELSILDKIAEASQTLSMQSWLIGGFVRDRILHRDTKNDLDIVCLGDGIALATETARLFKPAPKVSYFKNFGTAHFNSQGYDIEFVGARNESYLLHSRKP